eukprot:jgi/Botrbrau1/17234/Bobra.0865s0001.1
MVARVLLLSHRARMTRACITSKRHNNSDMFEMVFSNYLSRETEDGWTHKVACRSKPGGSTHLDLRKEACSWDIGPLLRCAEGMASLLLCEQADNTQNCPSNRSAPIQAGMLTRFAGIGLSGRGTACTDYPIPSPRVQPKGFVRAARGSVSLPLR